jgi:hypothetical protein
MPDNRYAKGGSHKDPVIGSLSLGELGEDKPLPWLAGGARDPAPSPPLVDPGDEEHQLAQALGALIQKDDSSALLAAGAGGVALAAMPRSSPASRGAEERTRPVSRRREAPWLGFRRLVDLLGMVLAFVLIWLAYQAFSALPRAPSQSPWALLGSGRVEAEPAPAVALSGKPDKALPPIGEFGFFQGVPAVSWSGLGRQEPVELYRSIYELEDAFEARYVPPPACGDPEARDAAAMTDCVNHRLSARRAFLASNGRTLVPDEAVRVREAGAGLDEAWPGAGDGDMEEARPGEPWQ